MGNYLHESQFVLDPFSDRNAVDMDSYKNPEVIFSSVSRKVAN